MKCLTYLCLLFGVVGFVSCGSDDAEESQTASSSDELTGLSFTWTRIGDEEFREDFDFSAPSSVTSGGPGLVTVGGWGDVRTSADGTTWSGGDATDGGWFDITAGGPGLVAVGTTSHDASVVMTSTDGITWSRVPHDEEVFGQMTTGADSRGETMHGVTEGGPGLVAVGTDGELPVVWTSRDGIIWSRTEYTGEVSGTEVMFDDPRIGVMFDVVAGGPGLIAVGAFIDSGAVWTSPDGVTWTRVQHTDALFGRPGENGQIVSLTTGGPGWVAVGHADDHPTVWTSVDGSTWSRVPYDNDVFGDDARLSSVITIDAGLVAVGQKGFDAAVWTSGDGTMWSRVRDDENAFRGAEMTDVAAAEPGLVAVGSYHEGGEAGRIVAAVWIATPVD